MNTDNSFPLLNGLPDAPLAMPKQVLESQRRSWFAALRAVLFEALARS